MKKMYAVCAIIGALIIAVAINIKPILNFASDSFWNWVAYELDKEEAERIKKMENGEPTWGRDTVLIWENMYDVWRNNGEKILSISTKEVTDNIIGKILEYKYSQDKLFIYSEEGYAVIDKDNLCRVLITVPEDEFVSGYSEDKEGNRRYWSRKVESEHIVYMTDYRMFSKEEREIFAKIEAKLAKKK